MTRQTVSVNYALQQGNYQLASGNKSVATQIFSQILDRFPDLHAARHGLKSVYQASMPPIAAPGIQQAVNDVQRSQYFKHAAIKGWAYSLVVDHPYISADLHKRSPAVPAKSMPFNASTLTPGHTPEMYFKLIREMKDIRERFDYLSELTQEQSLSLLADSFADTTAKELPSKAREVFSGEAINIVIIGAGVAGLAMANMLKNTFQDKINILLIENRIYASHYKKPYSRNWLTNVPLSFLQGVMDNDLIEVLSSLGKGGYIGVPINIFETLMLLSCKKLGVNFLYQKTPDISFLKNTGLDIVFDATGNRLNEVSLDRFPEQKIQQASADLCVKSELANNFSKFGITPEPCQDIERIDLFAADNLLVPAYNEQPIKTAMIKITGLPVSVLGPVFESVQQYNHDNRFYLWPGTLRDEINQALLIVNLTPPEFDALQAYLPAPLSLDIFLETFSDWNVLDRRFIALIKKIVQEVPKDYQARIEPPFLYEPFMLAYPQKWERIHGAPLIRIGDSIYNGHVKCGNGISPHLSHIRFIHDALLKGQIIYQ